MASSLLLAVLAALPAFSGDASNGDKRQAFRLWDEGISATLKDRPEEARAKWRQCLELDPDNRDCRAGLKLLGTSAPAGSVSVAGPASAPNPRDAVRQWHQGVVHFQKMDYAAAAKSWMECLRHDPQNEDCRTGLARVTDYLPQNAPAAPAAAVFAATMAPAGSAPDEGRRRAALRHWHAGIIYFQAGKMAQARDEWRLCAEFDPANSDCSTGLARIDSSP